METKNDSNDLVQSKVKLSYKLIVKSNELTLKDVADAAFSYKNCLDEQLKDEGVEDRFELDVTVEMGSRSIVLK